MNEILAHLKEKYHLLGMIVYAPYADGTNTALRDLMRKAISDGTGCCATALNYTAIF